MPNNEISTGIDVSLFETTNRLPARKPITGTIESGKEEILNGITESSTGANVMVQEQPIEVPIGYDWKILTPSFELLSTKIPIIKETTTRLALNTMTQRPVLTTNSSSVSSPSINFHVFGVCAALQFFFHRF